MKYIPPLVIIIASLIIIYVGYKQGELGGAMFVSSIPLGGGIANLLLTYIED